MLYSLRMRILLFTFLIFAIGFSGFSSVAHAFGLDSCCSAMKIEVADSAISHGMDMSDCPGHQIDNEKKGDPDQTNSTKKNFIIFSHFCAPHAFIFFYYPFTSPPLAVTLNPRPMHDHVKEISSSLLRPPKIIV